MCNPLRPIVAVLLLAWLAPASSAGSDSLASADLAQLQQYLSDLKSGAIGKGDSVDQLADISFAGLQATIEAYVELDEPIAPQTQRAFQALLERISRTANLPWPLIKLYSPELAGFLTQPAADHSLPQRLFDQLMTSEDRRSFDLAVRLTPECTLRRLATGNGDHRLDLLAAWNRYLGLRSERRPIPDLEHSVDNISQQFSLEHGIDESAALLPFIAQWPAQRERYQQDLKACLESGDPKIVLLGLAVQQRVPAELQLNEPLIARWPDDPVIVRAALKNYAFDPEQDHADVLRRRWGQLQPADDATRVACLFSMGVHPRGNDKIALAAVIDQPFAFIDVAIPVLTAGDRELARQAVEHILSQSGRSQEEALRLADALDLDGFQAPALRIALDPKQDAALRHTAILYLRLADGQIRRQLLPFLTHANADLRLAAIQMFGHRRGLTAEDEEAIGPALIRVALDDASMGHRQEAVFSLGNWRQSLARDFFRAVLNANPPTVMRRGYYASDDRYWQYRLRLVALLGLAKLEDRPAHQELLDLHARGGPAERMDVLLALLDLGEMSPIAFDDLSAPEPKLVATAAHLIDKYGNPAERERLRQYFQHTPLWLEFKHSGIDDLNLLEFGGLLHGAGTAEDHRETQ